MRKGSAALAPKVDRDADRQTSPTPSDEPALKDTGKSYWERRIPVIGMINRTYLIGRILVLILLQLVAQAC